MRSFIKIGLIFSLLSCEKDLVTPDDLLTAQGKVLEVYCSGTVLQLLGTSENMGQNWTSSIDGKIKVHQNVVLLSPISQNNDLLGKNIEFKYKKVNYFTLSKPMCDLGVIGLDTLYQVHSFKINL